MVHRGPGKIGAVRLSVTNLKDATCWREGLISANFCKYRWWIAASVRIHIIIIILTFDTGCPTMTTTTHTHNAIALYRVQRLSEIEWKKKKHRNSSLIMCAHAAAAASYSVSIIIIIHITVYSGGGGRSHILCWRYYILPYICIYIVVATRSFIIHVYIITTEAPAAGGGVSVVRLSCVILYYCIISSRPLVDEGRLYEKKNPRRNTFYTRRAAFGGSSRIINNNIIHIYIHTFYGKTVRD